MKIFRPNIRQSLTLWFGLSLGLILTIYSAGIYLFLGHNFYGELDRKLWGDVESIQEGLQDLPTDQGQRAFSSYRDSPNHDSRERWIMEVWSTDFQKMISVPEHLLNPLGIPDSQICSMRRGSAVNLTVADGLNLRTFCAKVDVNGKIYFVRVARSAERIIHELNELIWIIVFMIPASMFFTMLIGYFLARKSLAPVQNMTKQAQKISADHLNERLEVKNPNDELGKLAATFNLTFDRLEKSFRQMRQFTSDASHELRTPLTAIRAMGEVALREHKSIPEYREVLSSILEETDELRHLVDSLLTLSRADAGQVKLKMENFDLSKLAHEVTEHLSILAEEKNQIVAKDFAPGLVIAADRSFLRQAIINLLENAIKYSQPEKRIHIRTYQTDSGLFLAIEDEGPGIAQEHHSKIFERFYRVDSGRSRIEGGTGLGLSIAKWTVEAHGGTLEVSSHPNRGSIFTISLLRAK